MIRIYGDFNDIDAKKRVVLHDADDLKSERVELRQGLRVIVWQDETEIETTLERDGGVWLARLDMSTLRHRDAK